MQKNRETKQRKMVYEAVMSRCDHPTADDIYMQVHETDSKVSKGTIYRNLNILSDNKQITTVRVPGADRFDLRLDNHYHIICMECGKVEDAPFEYSKERDEKGERITGYKIERHRLLFEGICPECQKLKKEE